MKIDAKDIHVNFGEIALASAFLVPPGTTCGDIQ
jgi:hypothetical protein